MSLDFDHPKARKVRLPRWRRWCHLHLYDYVSSGPLDCKTLEPLPGGHGSGPCANLLRCRCGNEVVQTARVTVDGY